MASSSRMCIVAIMMVAMAMTCMDQAEAGWGDCYETWSRCSGWSSGGTGILWYSCKDRCVKDFGKRGGRCVLSPSSCPLSSQAYQCQCY